MNRHGLIVGATGTGKTKSLQVIAEQLSDMGVPYCLWTIQRRPFGDWPNPGTGHPKIDERLGTNRAALSRRKAYPGGIFLGSPGKGQGNYPFGGATPGLGEFPGT